MDEAASRWLHYSAELRMLSRSDSDLLQRPQRDPVLLTIVER